MELRTHSLTLSADNQHFVDEVRRQLIEEYGEEKIKTAGYTVRTTLDVFRQSKAISALRNGLKAVDKRRKYGQVLQRLKLKEMSTWQEKRSQALKGKPPSFGSRSKGLVIEVKPRMFVLDIGVGTAHLSRTLTERLGDSSEKPVFKIGDVIDIRIANDGDPHPKPRKALLGDLGCDDCLGQPLPRRACHGRRVHLPQFNF